MAVDVSKIPNNSKFDPVREAILNLQAQIGEEGQIAYDGILTINTSGNLSGSGTFTANQESNTTISIGITDTPTFTSITTDSLQFTGGTGTQGTLSWNADEETIDIIQNGATLQVGQEIQVHVKNQTGSTIPDGTPVYVTGTLGSSGRLTVAPMIADGSIEAKYFLGVTTEAIPDGEDGKVTTFGKIRGLDTTAYTEGTTLYVSATTAGAWQTTVPVAPALDLEVAIVINVHANNGTIFVRAQNGLYLGLLHDVYLNSPADGQLLVYNDTNSRWENFTHSFITLGDLSVTTNPTPFGSGALLYEQQTGTFEYTPPDLSEFVTNSDLTGYLEYTDLTVNNFPTDPAHVGGYLEYSDTLGAISFYAADVDGLIGLTDLSVTTETASGGGALSYDDTTGVFTFTPADIATGLDLQQVTANGNTTTYGISTGNISVQPSGTGNGIVAISANSVGNAALTLTPGSTAGDGVISTTIERAIIFKPFNTEKVIIASDGNMNVYEKLAVGKTTAASTYAVEVDGIVQGDQFKAQSEYLGTTYSGDFDQYLTALQIRTDDGGIIEIGGNGTGTVQNDVYIKDGDLDVSGNVTADFFVGDGSLLTNIAGANQNLQDVTDNGATTTNAITVAGLTSGNVQANGWLQAFGFLYTRDNLRVLNAAGTDWNTWGTRNNGFYDLTVGTINATGSITASSFSGNGSGLTSVDADLLDGRQLDGSLGIGERLFNNQGRNHTTFTDFNSANIRAGVNYLQQSTNGPTGSSLTNQWYGFRLGLGADYGTTTGASQDYASEIYWGRQSTGSDTYLWARDLENGTWGSWRKMSAGYADSSGSAGNADTLDGYHETAFMRLAVNSSSPTNGNFAVGSASGRNFIQSHNGQPLDLNPIGNNVTVGYDLSVGGTGGFGDYAMIGTSIPAGYYQDNNNGAYRALGTDSTRGYYFQSYNGASTTMYVGLAGTYAGRVGIGTTAPANKLHVYGGRLIMDETLAAQSAIQFNHAGTEMGVLYRAGGESDKLRMFITGAGDVMSWTNTGRVGVGTTLPSKKLHVYSSENEVAFFQGTSGGAWIDIQSSTSNLWSVGVLDANYMGIYNRTNSSYPMVIANGGNIGIGTTFPSEKLQVQGNLKVGTGATGNENIQLHYANGTGYYGALRFYESGSNNQTIHAFSTSWQGGNAFSASSGCINLTGANGVTFGGWNNPDVVFVSGSTNYFKNNVGIGSTSPIGKLQVGANTFSGNNGVYNNDRIGLSVNGSLTSIVYASTYNDAAYPDYGMVFIHGPNTSSYNVWSISPDGPAKGDSLNFIYGSNASNIHTTTPKVVFDGNGNVGIGTSTPFTKTHIYDTFDPDDTYGYLLVENGNTTSGSAATNAAVNIKNYHGTSQFMQWEENGLRFGSRITANGGSGNVYITSGNDSVAMTLLSNGNAGIGTTTPSAKLHVIGNITCTDQLNVSKTPSNAVGEGPCVYLIGNQGASYTILQQGVDSYKHFGFNGSSWVERMSLNNTNGNFYFNGNVGIGTSAPSNKLHVYSSANEGIFMEGTGGGHWFNFKSGTSNLWSMGAQSGLMGWYNRTDSTYKMVITDGGNVGINTTSPSSKLTVAKNQTTGGLDSYAVLAISENTSGNAAIGIHSTGDYYPHLDISSTVSGVRKFWHISKRNQANGNSLQYYYAENTTYNLRYTFATNGTFTATGDIIAYSDSRVKENVETIDNALDKVLAMRGVSYNRTDSEDTSKKVGVIAQEIEQVLPEVVTEDAEGMKGVAYGNIVGVLIEAIKEQQKQIDELKARLDGSTK